MVYVKQTWRNSQVGGTPISAARLNHIEDGLEAATQVAEAGASLEQVETAIVQALSEDETVVNAAAIATGFGWLKVSETSPSRSIAVTTTDTSTAITAAVGSFTSDDVGAPITGTGIPAGATITAVTSDTVATLSGAATATGTPTATIGIIKVSGLDVVWIDQSEQLTPIPVNAPPPTWNDATSQFTIPSGVVGIDYVWTSGGGGVPGSILTPGATVSTSGTYPRRVTITATPKPGYVSFSSGVHVHDFGNPATITTLTSDAFTAADDTDVIGTFTDATLGGAAAQYTSPYALATVTPVESNAFHRSSGQLVSGAANYSRSLWFLTSPNIEVSFDLVSLTTAGAGVFTIQVLRQRSPGSASYDGGSLNLATGRLRITGSGGDLYPSSGVPSPLGHYTIRYVGTTLTVTDGASVTRVFDMSSGHLTGQADLGTKILINDGFAAGSSWSIDNLVVKQIGA